MSIVVRFNPASLTAEKYDETTRMLEEAGVDLSSRGARLPRLLRLGGEPPGKRDLGLAGAVRGVR